MACMPSTYNVQTKWLAENNPDSDHLDENSSITERVAK